MTPTEEIVTQSHEAREEARRADYIRGLRAVADFLEQHPSLPCPWPSGFLVSIGTRAELAAIARTPGVRWKKDFQSEYFSLKATFGGGHVYDAYVQRGEVCERVVTGTRIEPATPEREVETFEWVCRDPLLATGIEETL